MDENPVSMPEASSVRPVSFLFYFILFKSILYACYIKVYSVRFFVALNCKQYIKNYTISAFGIGTNVIGINIYLSLILLYLPQMQSLICFSIKVLYLKRFSMKK